MRSVTYDPSISTVRANALFASALQPSDEPSTAQVGQAIAAAVRAFGAPGCAALGSSEHCRADANSASARTVLMPGS